MPQGISAVRPTNGLYLIRIMLVHNNRSNFEFDLLLWGICNCYTKNISSKDGVLNTIWSSIIRILPNTPEDGHIDVRNM